MSSSCIILNSILIALMTLAFTDADSMHMKLKRLPRSIVKNPAELETQFWVNKAQSTLANKLNHERFNTNRAKNIIMFLGDGMSVHTVTATRNFLGDSSDEVSFDKFPYVGLSKTYCVDKQVADSACSATAYLSGVKANYGTIGVNAQVTRADCVAAQDPSAHTESIAKWAQDAGMSTGLVTTARVTHASPAGVYAHTAERGWENDFKIIEDNCSAVDNVDIARQMVEWPVGRNLNVILGGGRREFRPNTTTDEQDSKGRRTDGRDLIQEWIDDKTAQELNASYVWNLEGLNAIDSSKTDYLLGLFGSSHCSYHGDIERKRLEKSDPTMSAMTEAAIRILQKNNNGFFLFVEGAKIDLAHHKSWAKKSLEETAEFQRAVQMAKDMTSEEDTLIVVTSDHSHTMTINGYPRRTQDIFGISNFVANDGFPFTILSYANGPGYRTGFSKNSGRRDMSSDNFSDSEYKYMAAAPLSSAAHGGEDVGVYASGPYAHVFAGNYEQNNIPVFMAYAADIGPFRKFF